MLDQNCAAIALTVPQSAIRVPHFLLRLLLTVLKGRAAFDHDDAISIAQDQHGFVDRDNLVSSHAARHTRRLGMSYQNPVAHPPGPA